MCTDILDQELLENHLFLLLDESLTNKKRMDNFLKLLLILMK